MICCPLWRAVQAVGPLFSVAVLCVAPASAAPTITQLSVRGLQTGAVTRLVIDGSELGPQPRVLLGSLVPAQQVQAGATPVQVVVDITLDAQLPPGVYLLRVASDAGISTALPIGVDGLPQAVFAPQVTTLPVSLTGALGGSGVLRTTFDGKKGQPIVVDVESRRLGSNLNPAIHLLDARRVQIAWSQGLPALGGDARCQAILPADGQYTVELHDALYRGADPNFFRLKIGELKYADLVYPLGARAGVKTNLAFLSTNLPESAVVEVTPTALGVQPALLPAGAGLLTGMRPPLAVGTFAEAVETAPPAGQVQELPAAPVGISGRLAAPGENDRYKLPVTPGQVLRFDVVASRVGSPVDGVLAILNEAGGQLATSDDRPGTSDPGLDFTVPADAKAILVSLRDLRAAGSPAHVYRVAVTPLSQPDMTLSIADERVMIPRDGVALVRVRAARQALGGPIKLSLPDLPAGVVVTNAELPAGASEALLTLSAPGANPAQSVLPIVADATEGATAIQRSVQVDETPVTRLQPWLRSEVAVAVVPAGPLAVSWEGIAADAKLVGAPIASQVKITRAAGVTGVVRLSLLTTQQIPKKTVKVNNQDKQVDDTDKAVRIDGAPMIAAEASESPVTLLVPADLPAGSYDLAIRAELLAADGKTAAATATSGAKRLGK